MSLTPIRLLSQPIPNLLPFCIAALCILWSFAFVAGKVGVTDCPPLILLSGRFLVAGLLIFGLSFLRRDRWLLSPRDIGVFAILGVVNNALYLGLGYIGLQSVSAGLGGLIISANPIFTAILAAILLGEALTWQKVGGLVLGIVGVALIVAHRLSIGSDGLRGVLVHARLARFDRGRDDSVQTPRAEEQFMGRQRHSKSCRRYRPRPRRADLVERQRYRTERAIALGLRIPRLMRIDPCVPIVVSFADGLRGDRGELVPFSHASARNAVRLAGPRGACGCARSAWNSSGRARHLFGDTVERAREWRLSTRMMEAPDDIAQAHFDRRPDGSH